MLPFLIDYCKAPVSLTIRKLSVNLIHIPQIKVSYAMEKIVLK
jgi:hypothetical protein